jgi:tRNA(Ile)-lysidine synthase
VVTPKGNLRVDPLARRLAESLRRECWLRPEAAVLVGVSGGGDSMALLCLLHALAAENRWRLEAFHANHGLRGEEADRAETLVREMTEALGLPLSVRALEIERKPKHRSFEEVARTARLEALREVCREREIDTVALAHTRDDLAETVLHRALRGTGLTGLAAMRPVTELEGLRLIRPLLVETREGLRLFLSDHQIPWDEDETNASPVSTRNRIRHTIRPLLRREINPRADEALARLAEHAAQDDAQLEADVDAQLVKMEIDLAKSKALLVDWLRSLSPALLRRVLRRWIMARLQSPMPPSSRHIEEIIAKIHAEETPARWTTHGGLNLSFKWNMIHMALPARLEVHGWPQWQGGERTVSPGDEIDLIGGWRLTITSIPGKDARARFRDPDVWLSFIDADCIAGGLTLRTRKTGDKFIPFGHAHKKLIRLHMSDLRIPRCVRGQLPLLCDEETILWGAGCRIADAVKITRETKNALEIRVIPPTP